MKTLRTGFAGLTAALLLTLAAGIAQTTPPAPEIGIVEKLGDTLPMQLEVYDERGYRVALKDVVKHPTVLTFVYFRCPSICSPLLT
mgnify:CR=1 FL=1